MSTAIHAILTGTFTSDGNVRNISFPSGYTEFSMINITDFGSTAANTNVITAYGTSSMAAGSALIGNKTSGAATIAIPSMITSGGLTFVADSGSTSLGAVTAITSITNATPPVVSVSSTSGLNSGDIVRVTDVSGQFNMSGLDFTINTIVANTSFNLAYMVAPGGAGTGGNYQRIPFDKRFYPRNRVITSISLATSAVIVMSVTHGFTVGQLVRIVVPSAFGMTQLNNQLVTITAINTTTNSITINVDTTSYTAFAFPSSATAALGVTFAQVVPVGEAATSPYQNLLDDATVNTSFSGVQIGTSAQTNAKLYQWIARRGQAI